MVRHALTTLHPDYEIRGWVINRAQPLDERVVVVLHATQLHLVGVSVRDQQRISRSGVGLGRQGIAQAAWIHQPRCGPRRRSSARWGMTCEDQFSRCVAE